MHESIVISADGSHTIISPTFNVPYHSKHGAIIESEVVFIQAGLQHFFDTHHPTEIQVFEMGFGSGLNALMTKLWTDKFQLHVNYHSIEAFPLPENLFQSLNYGEILRDQETFLQLHTCAWDEEKKISNYFLLKKYQGDVESVSLTTNFHVIYYDAFAPSSQPHLWQYEMMLKMFGALSNNGILVTYCAQGAFKRTLKEVGFTVECIPGPPGKREMVRAIKA